MYNGGYLNLFGIIKLIKLFKKVGVKMNILIVEDDYNLNMGIGYALEDEYKIFKGFSLEDGRKILAREKIDLLVLDLNLPDGDGILLINHIRKNLNFTFPIVVLSARNLETDMVLALKEGADDYIIKPFSLIVLREKIRKILERVYKTEATSYRDENMDFDFSSLKFMVDGEEISLSKTEIKLLKILIKNRGNIVTKERLIDEIWGIDGDFVDTNAVSVSVNRLKNKIIYKDRIENEYGVGYIWSI